ncbi:MAG: shikimate dehydrogenase [Eubacteriales bacterium]
MASQKLAVIGHPISHSLSPLLHNVMLQQMGFDGVYTAENVVVENLPYWVEKVRNENILGFNATMPHKEHLIPLLDELTEEARFYGAVNTVRNDNGRLIGHNTDGDGFYAMLTKHSLTFCDKHVIILGAGGSSGAIFKKAIAAGAKEVYVLNRTLSRAEDLCRGIPNATALELSAPLNPNADLLINTLPLGAGIVPNRLDGLKKSCAVIDILYAPPKTELLLAAEARGMVAINGLGMLIHQAILAFGFFYSVVPNAMEMADILYKKVEE